MGVSAQGPHKPAPLCQQRLLPDSDSGRPTDNQATASELGLGPVTSRGLAGRGLAARVSQQRRLGLGAGRGRHQHRGLGETRVWTAAVLAITTAWPWLRNIGPAAELVKTKSAGHILSPGQLQARCGHGCRLLRWSLSGAPAEDVAGAARIFGANLPRRGLGVEVRLMALGEDDVH